MITELASKVITSVLPAKTWYRAAFLFTKYYAKMSSAPAESWVRQRYPNSFRLNHALKLETLLRNIQANSASTFPIPVHLIGKELIDLASSEPNGFMVCTVHTPLNLAGVRSLKYKCLIINVILARNPPSSGHFAIPGTAARVPAIVVDRTALLKARSILQQGGCVITLVDSLADGQFSPNQFHLAAKLKAKLILTVVGLELDGTISVRLLDAIDFISITDSSAAENDLLTKINSLNQRFLEIMSEW